MVEDNPTTNSWTSRRSFVRPWPFSIDDRTPSTYSGSSASDEDRTGGLVNDLPADRAAGQDPVEEPGIPRADDDEVDLRFCGEGADAFDNSAGLDHSISGAEGSGASSAISTSSHGLFPVVRER